MASSWEMMRLGQWLCLHLLSQDCCYAAREWQDQGTSMGECNPRGTTMVEGDNFSTSGPGWTVECGKEPNVMS